MLWLLPGSVAQTNFSTHHIACGCIEMFSDTFQNRSTIDGARWVERTKEVLKLMVGYGVVIGQKCVASSMMYICVFAGMRGCARDDSICGVL